MPAYDDDLANPAPYGTWTAAQLWSRTAWINNSDFAEDMGVAIMNTRNGWHIVDYFGGHGFRVNIGKNVWEDTFGYPAEWPFDGGNLFRCWGTSSPEWQVLWITSETIKIPCDMTRGESGGPWLHGYDGNWGYLNGINSRIDRIAGPTVTFSPYFLLLALIALAGLRERRAAWRLVGQDQGRRAAVRRDHISVDVDETPATVTVSVTAKLRAPLGSRELR